MLWTQITSIGLPLKAADDANTLMLQLKTTDTTTGFSEKDIRSVTKLNFTVPRDFQELARLLENMTDASKLLFGPQSSHRHAVQMEQMPEEDILSSLQLL